MLRGGLEGRGLTLCVGIGAGSAWRWCEIKASAGDQVSSGAMTSNGHSLVILVCSRSTTDNIRGLLKVCLGDVMNRLYQSEVLQAQFMVRDFTVRGIKAGADPIKAMKIWIAQRNLL